MYLVCFVSLSLKGVTSIILNKYFGIDPLVKNPCKLCMANYMKLSWMAPIWLQRSEFWCPHRIHPWKLCPLQKSVVTRFISVCKYYLIKFLLVLGFLIYPASRASRSFPDHSAFPCGLLDQRWCSASLFILCWKVIPQLSDQSTMLTFQCFTAPSKK